MQCNNTMYLLFFLISKSNVAVSVNLQLNYHNLMNFQQIRERESERERERENSIIWYLSSGKGQLPDFEKSDCFKSRHVQVDSASVEKGLLPACWRDSET